MDTDRLLERAAEGDETVLETLFDRHRPRLKSMISLRIDPRLLVRVDPSDIVQEVFTEAHRRLPDYLRKRPMPFYAWLRQLAQQRLATEHRRHVRSQTRSVLRESRPGDAQSERSIQYLSRALVDGGPTPSERVSISESRQRVADALLKLAEEDREILVLRLVERLTTKETAAVLGIAEGTVGSRQFRALKKLKDVLGR